MSWEFPEKGPWKLLEAVFRWVLANPPDGAGWEPGEAHASALSQTPVRRVILNANACSLAPCN
jgi:hypothetical protein